MLQAAEGRSLGDVLAGESDAEEIAAQMHALVGGGETAAGGEAFWAVRRFLEALARPRPLVLVLEDVHWAEPTFLDLVEYLAEWSAKEPLFVLALARRDLLERRPQWALPTPTRTVVDLEPLPQADSRKLVDDLAESLDVTAETRERVVARAEGIPLYAEQLLAFAAERGLDEAPPTLEALLASRLDALDTSERAAIDCAAVVGRDFTRGAVVALAADEHAVGGALMSLVRRNLVRPARSTLPREDGFRFHHELVRDAAYDAIPGSRRAELHERLADWLERRGDVQDELLGHHLECAYREHERMGAVGNAERHLAHRGGTHLGNAGMRAFKLGDQPAARNLLQRATALLLADDPFALELRSELGIVQWVTGEAALAVETLGKAAEDAAAARNPGSEQRARLEQTFTRLFVDPETTADDARAAAHRAIPVFELLDDDRGLGRAWLILGFVAGGFFCQHAEWVAASEHAMVHYRRSGWPVSTPAAMLASALFYGPTPVPDALARCAELRSDSAVGKTGAADVGIYEAGLLACVGRFEEARTLLDEAVATKIELGQSSVLAMGADPVRGYVEMLAGDLDSAERVLRTCCETLVRLQAWAHFSTYSAEYARVLLAQGRVIEADDWAGRAEARADANDLSAQVSCRSVRARLLAHEGDLATAVKKAEEAARIVLETDALNQQGTVLLALAEVLAGAGREDEARDALERAVVAYELKGNVVAARAARKAHEGPFASIRAGN